MKTEEIKEIVLNGIRQLPAVVAVYRDELLKDLAVKIADDLLKQFNHPPQGE